MQPHVNLFQSRATTGNATQAFPVPATGNWDGNDGAWSTFMIRVGTPAQFFRMLPSTSGSETWIPIPDQCSYGQGWCGNARGVEPFNGVEDASPFSGSPNVSLTTSIDAGMTCTANKSPMCISCLSINGRCTDGPCAGRFCCGDPAGTCNSQSCNGLNGICTGSYIGCPCQGPDYNAAASALSSSGTLDAAAAAGFQTNQSSSWSDLGTHKVSMENLFNVSTNGIYGTDVIGLGIDPSNGPTTNKNVIAGVPAEPFYTGTFGLKPSESNNLSKGTPNFMSELKRQKSIPSLSYGYTAGAYYRQPPVLGSLVLGGYDASRSLSNNVSFPLAGPDSANLEIGLQSITASNILNQATPNTTVSILSSPINATIDTTLPFFYLPTSACAAFESAFKLSWDPDKALYLVNYTTHQALLSSNPIVTFTLGQQTSSQSINISLPFAAFNLNAASPIYPNGTNYFPLRRASNQSQFTLGRAFLQETYLFVEYEKQRFSISQAQFPSNPSPRVVTVDYLPNEDNSQPATITSSSNSLSRGVTAGIAVGSSAFVILLCAIAFFLLIRRRRRHRERASRKQSNSKASMTGRESWSNSPITPAPPYANGTADRSPSGNAIPIGELEDPVSAIPTGASHKNTWMRPQELAGGEMAQELPPTPKPSSPVGQVGRFYELGVGRESALSQRRRGE